MHQVMVYRDAIGTEQKRTENGPFKPTVRRPPREKNQSVGYPSLPFEIGYLLHFHQAYFQMPSAPTDSDKVSFIQGMRFDYKKSHLRNGLVTRIYRN